MMQTELYTSHIPTKVYPDVKSIDNNGFGKDEKLTYLQCILRSNRHQINISPELSAFDRFADHGIGVIIRTQFAIDYTLINKRSTTAMDKQIKTYRIQVYFTSAELDKPTMIDRSGAKAPSNPDHDRIKNTSYFGDLNVSLDISITAQKNDGSMEKKEASIKGLSISAIPIMIRSSHCNTFKLSKPMLKSINEDPADTGGYFIIMGHEKIINNTENLTFNQPLIFKPTIKSQKVFANLLSQRGSVYGNSTSLIVVLNVDNTIWIEFQSYQFNKIKLPFYVVYKLFGINEHREIAKMIVYEMEQETSESNKMLKYITDAFLTKYDVFRKSNTSGSVQTILHMFDIAMNLEDTKSYKKNDDATRQALNDLTEKLDVNVLPHVGITSNQRGSKLMYISSIIRDCIMVDMGLRQEDDRDHYANKRGHGASICLAKATKTIFNNKVIQPIKNVLQNECQTKSFETINLNDVTSNIRIVTQGKEVMNAFIKFINASEKSEVRGKEKTRMSAQAVERKNKLNVVLSLRQINASVSKVAKSTSRGDRMRQNHPSAVGYLCPAQTPETGEKVGTVKQLAITSFLTDIDSNECNFKKFIHDKDDQLIPLNQLDPADLARRFLAKILVDGEWIGACENPHLFVKRYRLLRREGRIDKYTSICWDSIKNVINFWLDIGRLMRPLLIVDNNNEEFNKSGGQIDFIQNILISHKDIIEIKKGKIIFDDLVKMGVVEYIYPGEEVLLCPTFEQLQKDRNNYTMAWTHCDIEQTIWGMAALIGPFLERNQSFRNTMVTIHSKQSCGQPMTNAFTATRRQQRFHMHRVHTPLVKTFTRELLPPNSQQGMILYAIFLGYNQEDSSIVNKASVERGFCSGVYFKMEPIELEKNQTVRIPKDKDTAYMRCLKYSKLGENGIIPVGTIVEKGDILVGKVVELSQPTADGKRFLDKSFPYDNEEPGELVNSIIKLDGEERFVILTFAYDREMSIGDKMSSRAGNKNICGAHIPQQDMPHTKHGLRPDVILNPASIPTRMTLAQLFETTINKLCAAKGQFTDGTVYTNFDINDLASELEKEGLAIREPMVNGITGELFDTLLFYGPQTIFRLPKFVKEDRHAVGRSGPTNPITGQPLTGKRLGGGHKVGEMEKWVFLSQGSMSTLYEEFYYDSDKKEIYICRGCNDLAIYNKAADKYKCNKCLDMADICVLDSCQTSIWLKHSLQMCNIKINLIPEQRLFEEPEKD